MATATSNKFQTFNAIKANDNNTIENKWDENISTKKGSDTEKLFCLQVDRWNGPGICSFQNYPNV